MGTTKVLTGNYAAAEAAALCRPDVIAAYPITPQSSVAEKLAEFAANGTIDSTIVQVEGEHSAMSVIEGAAAAGGRVFTATAAQGLAFMYEPYFRMSTLRLPMVMALSTREMTSPETVWSGQQDAISVRDAGWIICFCDDNQEIMDMIIQGYMLAEDPEILIPVNVCYDGFYSSHLTEAVDVPERAEVDEFLPPASSLRTMLDPEHPLSLDPMTPGDLLIRYRKTHLEAMQRAKEKIEEIDQKFCEKFGRSYGGLIDTYRLEDAEVVIVTIAGMTGTGKDAVDIARTKGIKAGLIKLRFIRPFPAEKIREALDGKKAFAVIDRSVCFGWSEGPNHMEIKAALDGTDSRYAHFSVIGGLGGADIPLADMLGTIEHLEQVKDEPGEKEVTWYIKSDK